MRSLHTSEQNFYAAETTTHASPWFADTAPSPQRFASWPMAWSRRLWSWFHLHRRCAALRLAMPLWRRYAIEDVRSIAEALDLLFPLGTDCSAGSCWRNLVSPCLNGERDRFKAVLILIRHGIVKPNQFGSEGHTLLHATVCSGRVGAAASSGAGDQHIEIEDRIRLLVQAGAEPDRPTLFDELALQLAWQRASVLGDRIAVALLQAGANPMKRDCNGHTLLHRAARTGDLSVVQGWRKIGLDLNPTGGMHGGQALLQTPLMLAVMAGRRETVEVLIERDTVHGAASAASLDRTDVDGATALHWAVDYDRPELAELLCMHGADAHLRAGRDDRLCLTPAQLSAARQVLQPGRPILRWLLTLRALPDRSSNQFIGATGRYAANFDADGDVSLA